MTVAKGKRTYFPEGHMKQRSFYMDDETYALIESYAEGVGVSRGSALRHIVRHVLLDAPAEPLNSAPLPPPPDAGHQQAQQIAVVGREHVGIVLPPDRQETFKVPERFKEKGPRVPKAVHSDDDF